MSVQIKQNEIDEIARKHGFDYAERIGIYFGYEVYRPICKQKTKLTTGMPKYILVDGKCVEWYVDDDLKFYKAIHIKEK